MDDIDRWHWLNSPPCGLLRRQGHIWMVRQFTNQARGSRRYKAHTSHWLLPLPADSQRATVHRYATGECTVAGTSNSATPSSNSSPPVARAWMEARDQCDAYFGWSQMNLIFAGAKPLRLRPWLQSSFASSVMDPILTRWVQRPSNC